MTEIKGSSAYALFIIVAIVVGIKRFHLLSKNAADKRFLYIFFGGMLGAFAGAKLFYIICEGYFYYGTPQFLTAILSGKTILGGLLGGVFGVEFTKWIVGYEKFTGDQFALFVPGALLLGRIGCLFSGCCKGIPLKGWIAEYCPLFPAVELEIVFHGISLFTLTLMYRRGIAKNQLFNMYLISYGIFRFFSEFYRDNPHLNVYFSVYQPVAVLVVLYGIYGMKFSFTLLHFPKN
jgi:phosphatidylglycerol:prolipoprotein diacylglycerol transferase